MDTEKILKYAGLAAAGRNVVYGTDLVLSEIRKKKKGTTVLLATDASERTKKQITDKCSFHGATLIPLDTDMETLAKRCGKSSPTAVVAITSPSLAKEIKKHSES